MPALAKKGKKKTRDLWLEDSRAIVRHAKEIIRQQEFYQSRPTLYGERWRTFMFVNTEARKMVKRMERCEKRERRDPEGLFRNDPPTKRVANA